MHNIYLRSVIVTDMGSNIDRVVPTETATNFSVINNEYDERQQIDADNVAILDGRAQCAKENMLEPMSIARYSFFIASLLLCFGTVIIFVWFIPCNMDSTCPAFIDRSKTHNWLNNYTKIELKGPAHIVSGWRWMTNLIFLYRGDILFSERSNSRRNGVISLISQTGAISWLNEMTDEPIALDCTLIDIDRDGQSDCLIMDEYGEVGVINSMTGVWHWHFNERSASKVDINDFPLILPDLDNDGIMELLIVTSISLEQRTKHYVKQGDIPKRSDIHKLEQRNSLTILSGRSGRPIGEPFRFHECNTIKNLCVDAPNIISFSCLDNNTANRKSKSLSDLFALVTNQSLRKTKIKSLLNISQYHHSSQNDPSRNVYSLSGRELLIENHGKCPDCNVLVILSQSINGKSQILQNFTENFLYGMKPVQWNFKKNGRTFMSGFIMKFWKWSANETTKEMSKLLEKEYPVSTKDLYQKINNTKRKSNVSKSTSKHNHLENKFSHFNQNGINYLFHEYKENYTFNYIPNKPFSQLHRIKIQRDAADRGNISNSSNSTLNNFENVIIPKRSSFTRHDYKMHLITESVVLVIFAGTETHIQNISQSKVIQFCWNPKSLNGVDKIDVTSCQPDISNQDSSMIVEDLDHDGYQELITCTPTFVHQHINNTEDWHLISYVRLMRLELELLKYYHYNEKFNEN